MTKKALALSLDPFVTHPTCSQGKDNDSLNAEGWIGGKSCLVIIGTGAPITIARLDITAGLPKRELTRSYILQMASVETHPVLKEALVELLLGRGCPLAT
jgi:hypothetical protein